MAGTSGAETVAVVLESRLPLGFQGEFDERLVGPVTHGRDPERSFLVFPRFGDPDPSGWLRRDGFGLCEVIDQGDSFRGVDGGDPIDSRGSFAPVVLRDPSHSDGPSRLGFHQETLETAYCVLIAGQLGLVDALLDAVHVVFQLAPGHQCPALGRRHCCRCRFRFFHPTRASTYPIAVSPSAYPGHYPRRWLLGQSPPVGACSLDAYSPRGESTRRGYFVPVFRALPL